MEGVHHLSTAEAAVSSSLVSSSAVLSSLPLLELQDEFCNNHE